MPVLTDSFLAPLLVVFGSDDLLIQLIHAILHREARNGDVRRRDARAHSINFGKHLLLLQRRLVIAYQLGIPAQLAKNSKATVLLFSCMLHLGEEDGVWHWCTAVDHVRRHVADRHDCQRSRNLHVLVVLILTDHDIFQRLRN